MINLNNPEKAIIDIIAIDPGTTQSAYVHMRKINGTKTTLIDKGIVKNELLLNSLQVVNYDLVSIEMIASYGMPVGADVFNTVVWIGRFIQAAIEKDLNVHRVYRKDIKMHLCHTMKAKDSNIRQALIDKYGVPGTKKSPNPFYNDGETRMKKDIWAALAVLDYSLSLDGVQPEFPSSKDIF